MTASALQSRSNFERWDDSTRGNVHVRQNFASTDRPGGYEPPQTNSLGLRKSAGTGGPAATLSPSNVMSERDAVPFDMVDEVHQGREPDPGRRSSLDSKSSIDQPTVQETSFQSVWESSPERMKPGIVKNQSIPPHYSIRGPRYSDPSILSGSRGDDDDASLLHVNSSERRKIAEMKTPTSHYQEISVQPSSTSGNERPDHDQRASDGRDRVQEKRNSVHSSEVANEVDMQFPEVGRRPVKVTHKVRRRSPNHHRELPEGDADDTSIESATQKRRSPNGLQERAQQAWRSRQKKNSSLRSNRDPELPRATNNVSFRGADTVQYFDPHVDEATDETGISMDEKSLNSEYTKTLESEVEDMIKDIFFIGSGTSSQPGRRKYKYKHDVKKRLRDQASGGSRRIENPEDTDDDDFAAVSRSRESRTTDTPESKTTTETPAKKEVPKKRTQSTTTGKNPNRSTEASAKRSQSTTTGKKPNKSTEASAPRKTLNDVSKTEAALWGFLDSSVAAVSSVLGFPPEEKTGSKSTSKSVAKSTSKSNPRVSNDLCTDPVLPFGACTGGITPEEPPTKPALSNVFDAMYGQYGELIEANGNSGSKDSSKGSNTSSKSNEHLQNDSSKESTEETNNLPFSLEYIDEDPRTAHLALHAAKSLHQTQGVQFDASYPISLHEDLQISVVELKMPLGLIFLENEGGCFVTKVSPDGSANRSGGVEIGDQLAAINGESSARMRVDDICDVIARSPTAACVELVFLRYVGPFRPNRHPQRGTEGPSFDLDITGYCQPSGEPSQKHEKKRGFRMFGRKKRRDGAKKK